MALLSHIPYYVLQTIRAAEGTHARSSRENCSASRRVEGGCAVRSRIDAGADPLSPEQNVTAVSVRQTVWDVSYAGDEGGIVCHLSRSDETGQALVVSLTHVRVARAMPLVPAVLGYQKHRVKKLKK